MEQGDDSMSDRFDAIARKLAYGAKRCVTSEDVGVAERLAEALRKLDAEARAEQREIDALIADDDACGCGSNTAALIRANNVPGYIETLISKRIAEARAEERAITESLSGAIIAERDREIARLQAALATEVAVNADHPDVVPRMDRAESEVQRLQAALGHLGIAVGVFDPQVEVAGAWICDEIKTKFAETQAALAMTSERVRQLCEDVVTNANDHAAKVRALQDERDFAETRGRTRGVEACINVVGRDTDYVDDAKNELADDLVLKFAALLKGDHGPDRYDEGWNAAVLACASIADATSEESSCKRAAERIRALLKPTAATKESI
jgi:hypothetical protein